MRIQDVVMRVGLAMGLLFGSAASAALPCAPGVPIKNSANEIVGCQYREWTAATCSNPDPAAMHPISPTNAGFCLTCLYEPYRSQVVSGNWSGLNPNDFTCTSCINKPSGSVAWWSFDESENFAESYDLSDGLNSWDRIAMLHAGVVEHLPGMVQGAWRLDGVDDYIEVEDHPSLNFGEGNFSFEGWVRLDSTGFDYSRSYALLDKRVSNPYRGYHIALLDQKLVIQLADGTHYNWVSTFPIPKDNTWHHIAITVSRTSSTGLKIYVDGQVRDTFNPVARSGSLTNTARLLLGRNAMSTSSPLLRIGMDEFALYKRALTATEILRIFNSGRFGTCKNFEPESWWPKG